MITIKQIREALSAKNYPELRKLHDTAKIDGIEDCDKFQLSTLNLCILEVSMFRDDAAYQRCLLAMLDAIERGNHPYDDIISLSTLEAEAVIAKAQLDAMIPKR